MAVPFSFASNLPSVTRIKFSLLPLYRHRLKYLDLWILFDPSQLKCLDSLATPRIGYVERDFVVADKTQVWCEGQHIVLATLTAHRTVILTCDVPNHARTITNPWLELCQIQCYGLILCNGLVKNRQRSLLD